jgi:hypothetical protein
MVTGEELAMVVAPVGRDDLIVDLFRRRGPALIGLARALVDSREEAEEVVQEAFARLVASFVRIDDSGRADRYLTVTVLNVARSRLRRRRTAREKGHLLRAADDYLDEFLLETTYVECASRSNRCLVGSSSACSVELVDVDGTVLADYGLDVMAGSLACLTGNRVAFASYAPDGDGARGTRTIVIAAPDGTSIEVTTDHLSVIQRNSGV